MQLAVKVRIGAHVVPPLEQDEGIDTHREQTAQTLAIFGG